MTRAQELVAAFDEVSEAYFKTVEELTDEQWRLKTTAEGWSVAAVAHHIAFANGVEQLEGILRGDAKKGLIDTDEIDAQNAQHAGEFADCTKKETLDLARHAFSSVGRLLGRVTDEQVNTRGEVPGGSDTIDHWLGNVMVNHVVSHHESIIETISQNPTP